MFLHVGNNRNIRQKDIIGIFDADTATVATTTRRFLAAAEKRGEVSSSGEEVPKSFILYREAGKMAVCFSQISPAALIGRSEKPWNG